MKKILQPLATLSLAGAIAATTACSPSLQPKINSDDLYKANKAKYEEIYNSLPTGIIVDEGKAVALTLWRNLDIKVKEIEKLVEGSQSAETFLKHAPSLIYTHDKRERDKLALSTSERLNDDGTVEEIDGVDTNPSYSSDLDSETKDLTLQVDLLNLWQYYYESKIHKANVEIRARNRDKAAQNVTVDAIENFKLAQIAQTLKADIERLTATTTRIKNGSCSVIGTATEVKDALLRQCKEIVGTSRDLPGIMNQLNEARINFNALITAHPTTEMTLAPINMQSMPQINKDLDELVDIALYNSTELEIERFKYIIAKNEQYKAWTDILPSLTIGVSRKEDDNRFLVNDNWEEEFATLNLNFIQKMVSAPYRARTAKYKALAADDVRSKAAIVTLATKVALSVDAYNTSIDKWENSNQLALISKDEFHKADAKKQSGNGTEFDQANAETQMLFHQLQSMLDYANMWGAAARLYGALGMRIIPTDQLYTDYSVTDLAKAFNEQLASLGIKG